LSDIIWLIIEVRITELVFQQLTLYLNYSSETEPVVLKMYLISSVYIASSGGSDSNDSYDRRFLSLYS